MGIVEDVCHDVSLNVTDRSGHADRHIKQLTETKKGESDTTLSPTIIDLKPSLSDFQDIDQLLHGRRTLVQCRTLVVRQADLDDLLDTVLPELDRDADK